MASLTDSPVIIKEGPHREVQDLEFWAEDGVIVICDKRDGQVNCVTCKDFA
jgi:hypothetical protein